MNEDAKIFIVDDDASIRDSLSLLIEQEGMVVETFASAQDFLAHDLTQRGCAILDLRMPGMDGLQLQAELIRRGIVMPIIFLTGYGDVPTSVRAIKAGAVDFLTKPVRSTELFESLHAALRESDRLYGLEEVHRSMAQRLAGLTERERDVMLLAIEGLPNKEIARRLDISHRTVEIHKARIMGKTGVKTVLELSRIAQASAAPWADRSAGPPESPGLP